MFNIKGMQVRCNQVPSEEEQLTAIRMPDLSHLWSATAATGLDGTTSIVQPVNPRGSKTTADVSLKKKLLILF